MFEQEQLSYIGVIVFDTESCSYKVDTGDFGCFDLEFVNNIEYLTNRYIQGLQESQTSTMNLQFRNEDKTTKENVINGIEEYRAALNKYPRQMRITTKQYESLISEIPLSIIKQDIKNIYGIDIKIMLKEN